MVLDENATKLRRRISLFGLTMYGVGIILGAGIYALIGEVVGLIGNLSWLAFVLASIVGVLTGLSYAELAAMYPKSAAEFVYVEQAFKLRVLSFSLGWIIIFSGLFSAATVALSFGNYLADLIGFSNLFVVITIAILLIIVLSMVNYIGIKESTWTNILFTSIEIIGLVIIIIIGIPYLGTVNYLELPAATPSTVIFSSVALIFFAYVGFEDIANIAEEVRDPYTNLPKAIIFSIIITTIIYCLTSLSVVSIVPYTVIASSAAPLRTVVSAVLGSGGGLLMSFIALFATANTVLIIMIVTSRMLYGMARDKALPAPLCKISVKHRTPTLAVFLTMVVTIGFLFFGDISIVANATVFGVLITFLLVNLSLIILRKKNPETPRPFQVRPNFGRMPLTALLGVMFCFALLFTFDWLIIGIQVVIIGIGLILFYLLRSKIETTVCD